MEARDDAKSGSSAGTYFVGDDPAELAPAREWLTTSLQRSAWLYDEDIQELCLAITEALTNLLQHAGPRGKSELTVHLHDQHVDVLIRDDSPPVDIAAARGTDAVPHSPGDDEAGYGLLLLHMLADEVESSPDGSGGSILRLTKRRPSP